MLDMYKGERYSSFYPTGIPSMLGIRKAVTTDIHYRYDTAIPMFIIESYIFTVKSQVRIFTGGCIS